MDCCVSTRAYFKAQGLLGGKPKTHYRRSTTSKAPRKRTFIMNMEKYNPGVRSEGSGGPVCKLSAVSAVHADIIQPCCGGNDGAMGGNGGSFVSRKPRFGGDSNDSTGGNAQPLPRAVVLGVAALLAGLVFLPSQAVAVGSARPLYRVGAARSSEPAQGRNMCINASGIPAEVKATLGHEAIVYGDVQLSAAERRLLGRRQLWFKETLRTEAINC